MGNVSITQTGRTEMLRIIRLGAEFRESEVGTLELLANGLARVTIDAETVDTLSSAYHIAHELRSRGYDLADYWQGVIAGYTMARQTTA